MTFDPKNFFIGLMDLFSILMPGALFTFMVQGWAGPLLLGKAYTDLVGTAGVVAFLFASYLFGHVIFLVASHLDDAFDKVRGSSEWSRMSRAARGRSARVPVTANELRDLLWGRKDIDGELQVAARIKDIYLGRANAAGSINAFQWSKLRLQKDPEAYAVVQRFEADSKFFRSFSVVLALLAPIAFLRGNWELGMACLVLMLLALWRFTEQRLKSTQQAYRSIIAMHADGAFADTVPLDGRDRSADAPTHAGGVVYRVQSRPKKGGKKGEQEKFHEYLLVRANSTQELWVLPKGHIEPWEWPALTAVREVQEESGAWCVVESKLEDLNYQKGDEHVRARMFRMRCEEEEKPKEERKVRWFTYFEAVRQASHETTRALITRVHEQLTTTTHHP